MKHAAPMQSSFAMLFDPAVALAAAKRAAQWDLPRHICHPLDHYHGARVSSDLAAYDAAIDLAPLSDDEMSHDPLARDGAEISDAVIDDTDDL